MRGFYDYIRHKFLNVISVIVVVVYRNLEPDVCRCDFAIVSSKDLVINSLSHFVFVTAPRYQCKATVRIRSSFTPAMPCHDGI